MNNLVKNIPLTQGYEAIVDADDYDDLMNMGKWYAYKDGQNWIYARRNERVDGKRSGVRMHRIVMNAAPGMIIDHKNGNGLDNRKSNLRICTRSQNGMNRRSNHNSSSRFKGVSWHELNKKWFSMIMVNGKHNYIGSFDDEVDAAKAYDKAAKKLHGDFARLNFPNLQKVTPKKKRRVVNE